MGGGAGPPSRRRGQRTYGRAARGRGVGRGAVRGGGGRGRGGAAEAVVVGRGRGDAAAAGPGRVRRWGGAGGVGGWVGDRGPGAERGVVERILLGPGAGPTR